MKNYYRLLGISPTSSDSLIQEAYRTKLRQIQSGSLPLDPSQVQRLLQELQEAYEVLTDPQRRVLYDRMLLEHLMFGGRTEETTPDLPMTPPAAREYREQIVREGKKLQQTRSVRGFLGQDRKPPKPAPTPAPQRSEAEEALLRSGELLAEGRAEEAAQLLQRHVEEKPESVERPKVLLRLAEIYLKYLHSPERASETYRELLHKHRGTVEAVIAEQRLSELPDRPDAEAVGLPTAVIVQNHGDFIKLECPRCQAHQFLPYRPGQWYICGKCGSKNRVPSK